MSAVHSDLSFVQSSSGLKGGCGCGCNGNGNGGGSSIVFRTVWDRLVQQLFDAMPPGMLGEGQIPNVDLWDRGVALQGGDDPYTFAVVTDEEDSPIAGDVISYKGKYYIIGSVQ